MLRRWETCCNKLNENLIYPSVNTMLEFFLQLYKGGCLCSGLCAARSALASVVSIAGYSSISEHPMIARFLKGIFNRHPLAKYVQIRDINVVLSLYNRLPENPLLSLEDLTQKLLMLLKILGARRKNSVRSTVDNIKISNNEMVLLLCEVLKNTRQGSLWNPLFTNGMTSITSFVLYSAWEFI